MRTAHAASLWVCFALVAALAEAAPKSPQWLGPTPPKKLERVVTLAPSLTETVIRLGRADVLVGVTRYDEAKEVEKVTRVGGLLDPSVETVLTLKPDLLIAQYAPGNQRPIDKLAELGVPVLSLPLHSVEETLNAIETIGRALNREEKAAELVKSIRDTRARIRARAADTEPRRVMVIYGFEPLVVAGPGSFADELLRDAGAENVIDTGGAYVVLPLERALVLKPEVVIDASYSSAGRARVKGLPGLSGAKWVQPPSKALLQPGPSLGRALEELAEMIGK